MQTALPIIAIPDASVGGRISELWNLRGAADLADPGTYR